MRLRRSRARPVTRSPRRPSPRGRRSRRTRRRQAARWRTAPRPSARRSRKAPRRPRRACPASPTSRSRRAEPERVRPVRASAGLHLDSVSLAEYQSAEWSDVLGVATFSATPDPVGTPVAEIPVARVSTPVLPGTEHIVEVWRCTRPATSGQRQRVRFRRTAEMLFGCIAVSEAELAPGAADPVPGARCGPVGPGAAHSALHEATTQAYREICATVDAENYP